MKTTDELNGVWMHGWNGHGQTLSEARKDLARQLAEAVAGNVTPQARWYRGWLYVTWVQLGQWCYFIRDMDALTGKTAAYSTCMGNWASREQVAEAARKHINGIATVDVADEEAVIV